MSTRPVLQGRAKRSRHVRSPRLPRAVVLVTAVIFSLGIALNGLNNAFGNAVTCAMAAGLLLVFLVVWPPKPGFFTARSVPLAIVVAGTGWALLPNILPEGTGPNLRPDLVLSETLGIAGALCALLCGSRIGARRGDVALTVDALVGLAAINVVAGLILRSSGGQLPFDLWQVRADTRFTGTLSNANVVGAYCGMMAALAFSRLLEIRFDQAVALPAAQARLARAGAYLVAMTLLLAACFLTGSRSAGTATAVVLAALGVWRLRRDERTVSINWALLAAGAVVLLILAGGISDLLLHRLDAAAAGDRSGRPEMWAHYTQLFLASPWFGYGLGSFETLNAQYLGDPRLAQGLWTVNSAHNLFLQFVLDGGIVYLAALAVAALLVGRSLAARIAALNWHTGSDGIVGAFAIVVACAMVDIALDVPAVACLTTFMAGLLWTPGRYPSRNRASEPPASGEETIDMPRFAG